MIRRRLTFKTLLFISILITFTQCTQQQEQDVVNPIAVEENDQEYKRDLYEDNDNVYKDNDEFQFDVVMDEEQEVDDPMMGRQGYSGGPERGVYMVKKDFDQYWPPRKIDGTVYEQSEAGLAEWEIYKKGQVEIYENYARDRKKLSERLAAEYKTKFGIDIDAAKYYDARSYPYCVDGIRPFMDRYMIDKTKFGPIGSEELRNGSWTKEWKFIENPKCPKSKDHNVCIDPDLERFMPLFKIQPFDGPVVSDFNGRPPIEHTINGKDLGPYIQQIKFTKIFSPKPPLGISGTPPDGSPELPFWLHIIVKSRIELEGLFIQAIGFPMGLPFGNFRDDFHCDPEIHAFTSDKVYMLNPDRIDVSNNQWTWANGVKLQDRATTTVPCKYSHGNNNGDMHPNVYVYGGRKKASWKKRTEFKVHFQWSSLHCNLKTRVQFLVMAVLSFARQDFETFLTPNYLLNQNNAAGSPPPYVPGSKRDFGWDESMLCNEAAVITSTSQNHAEVTLRYNEPTSTYPIPYNHEYDRCILNDRLDLDTSLFFADSQSIYEGFGETGVEPFSNREIARNNWVLSRKMLQICPPNDVCLNERDEAKIQFDQATGHEKDVENKIRVQFESLQIDTFPSCKILFCAHPEDTRPILIQKSIDDDEDPEEKKELQAGGTRFSEDYVKKYYEKGTRFMRKTGGTHVWCMTLAWFVLMALGVFVGRYYKETAGINPETKNSLLGLGWWIWVHIGLFLLSLTFMWIGILETTRFRQRPISCNFLDMFGEYNLKNFCRWKKKIVRRHRKWGIAAAAFYHIALAISWVRPARNTKIPIINQRISLRKIFLVIHVFCAYIGKILCVTSVMFFFDVRNLSICKSIPILLLIAEFVSIVFFVVGWIIQYLEDSKSGRSRRTFPVPEAIEPFDDSSCYMCKIIVVVSSVLIHLALFLLMALMVKHVYGTNSQDKDNQPGSVEHFEDGFFGTQCNITSAATELQASMVGYYYKRRVIATEI